MSWVSAVDGYYLKHPVLFHFGRLDQMDVFLRRFWGLCEDRRGKQEMVVEWRKKKECVDVAYLSKQKVINKQKPSCDHHYKPMDLPGPT